MGVFGAVLREFASGDGEGGFMMGSESVHHRLCKRDRNWCSMIGLMVRVEADRELSTEMDLARSPHGASFYRHKSGITAKWSVYSGFANCGQSCSLPPSFATATVATSPWPVVSAVPSERGRNLLCFSRC